jgi:hypothetical protein
MSRHFAGKNAAELHNKDSRLQAMAPLLTIQNEQHPDPANFDKKAHCTPRDPTIPVWHCAQLTHITQASRLSQPIAQASRPSQPPSLQRMTMGSYHFLICVSRTCFWMIEIQRIYFRGKDGKKILPLHFPFLSFFYSLLISLKNRFRPRMQITACIQRF